MDITEQSTAAIRLAIAALIGLGIGLERQWSGHASGPTARFAGLRTFFMLGALGGTAGLLLGAGYEALGAVLAAGGILFAIVAFITAVTRPGAEYDATTEVAAIVVIALGIIAGLGWILLAAGAGSVIVLALYEKGRLHDAVTKLGEAELQAALRFAVLALVVLPLLPREYTFAGITVGPRALWIIVLLFLGLDFAAYIARRFVSTDRGYAVTGLLGGLVSSTAVTLEFSRRSREEPAAAGPLAAGVIGASTILVPRVIIVSLVLNEAVGIALLPFLLPLALVGVVVVAMLWRSDAATSAAGEQVPRTPLRLWYAIRLALAFQVAMLLVDFVRDQWAAAGLYTSAALIGTTDVDALTVSMNRLPDGLSAIVAARAITVGVLANTVTKMAIALLLGAARYRLIAGAAMLAMAVAAALAAWLL